MDKRLAGLSLALRHGAWNSYNTSYIVDVWWILLGMVSKIQSKPIKITHMPSKASKHSLHAGDMSWLLDTLPLSEAVPL